FQSSILPIEILNNYFFQTSKKKLMYYKKIIIALFFVFVLFSNLIAQKQDTISEIKFDEIVIQSSKNQLKYKELPASVSILTTKNIQQNQITTLSDISSTAPNFFMPDYGSKLTSPVYIRGIGSRINSPSVGLYVDNVPYFEKAAFAFDFFEIKQIEVLRGPQGTLFGRNTMGGIINIVTISPLYFQGTNINLSAGSYGSYNANIANYGLISNKIGYSLALNYKHNDGFFTNNFNNTKIDVLSSFGVRNRLIWKISDKFSVENIASFEKSDQGGYPYAVFNDSTQTANDISYNEYSGYNRNLFSDAFILKYSSNNFEIVSTSSYQFIGDEQNIDQDFTDASLYLVKQTQKQNMISQEIITRSKSKKAYNWILGAYSFAQMFDKSVDVTVFPSNMTLYKNYLSSIYGVAAFHQSTFKIGNIVLTAGIRFDYEQNLLDYEYDIEMAAGNIINKADTLYPALDYLQVLPKFSISYSFTNTSVYATIAKGYKTGGFNSTFERPEDLTFDPEYSWNYEAGVKSSLINQKLYVDIALFYIDWRNQQIYQTVPSGQGSMLKNAGHSVSKGSEFSIQFIPKRNLQVAVNYGYTHATFISNVVDSLTNYNGNFIPYVPQNTVSIQLNKTIVLNNLFINKINFSLVYKGIGDLYWNEENTSYQKYYNLVDAKISFIKNIFQFDLWGKNLLNQTYNSFYFEALGNKYVQIGKPLQFGASLSVKF
ncbi:MAG: TonB-dependent receptor, partial [Bacteroidales bacterium]|nr:TonB-dependent receptor [Bacteroidales bacterium]